MVWGRDPNLFFCMWMSSGTSPICVWCVCFNICQFILKAIIKDTDVQPVEEVPRTRSGRVTCGWASVSMGLGCTTLSAHGCDHQPESSPALFVEKTVLFPTEWFWQLCLKKVNWPQMCNLYLNSQFHSIGLYIYPSASTMLFWLL